MCSNKTYYKRIFSVSFVYKLSNLNEKCFKPILRSLEIVSHFDIIVNLTFVATFISNNIKERREEDLLCIRK